MPEYLAPGVYIEEVPTNIHPIEGVPTSTAAFVDIFKQGPINKAVKIVSFAGVNIGGNLLNVYAGS